MLLFPDILPVAVWAKVDRVVGGLVRRSMLILPQNAMYNPEPTRPWRSCADLFWWDMAFFSPSSWLHISRWKDFQGSQIDNPPHIQEMKENQSQ